MHKRFFKRSSVKHVLQDKQAEKFYKFLKI